MSNIEHSPLVESERLALRRYADGLDEDWAIGVLIGSAVWNVERLETQLAGAVSLAEVCEFLRSTTYPDPATGGDRHPHGYKAAAADLERRFGGQ
jgi:hypothetical protein